jgi:hypothetical protein
MVLIPGKLEGFFRGKQPFSGWEELAGFARNVVSGMWTGIFSVTPSERKQSPNWVRLIWQSDCYVLLRN